MEDKDETMSHCTNLEPVVLSHLPENLERLRILDVGIGHGLWAFILRSRKQGHPYIVGVEPHPLYIQWAHKAGLYDELHEMTVQKYLEDNPLASFNYILLCEVIEHHRTHEEAYNLMENLEKRIRVGGIIITTPNGHSNGASCADGNELSKHPIGFREKDFKQRGYETVLVEGPGNFNRLGRFIGLISKVWFTLRRGSLPVTNSIVAWKESTSSFSSNK
jgi:SAM-dependent methyltransferase